MDIASVTSKGQVTIPIGIRRLMNIKEGDKILFFEKDGKVFVENAAMVAFDKIQKGFEGEAEKAGFKTEKELQDYVKSIRKEMRGQQNEDNA